jgi:DNA (cytosine-5)-methyltransferase 1
LASVGYDAEWENIPASAVGAPHRRERVWIMAYPNEGKPIFRKWTSGVLLYHQDDIPEKWDISTGQSYKGFIGKAWFREGLHIPVLDRKPYGFPNGVDRIAALGNAVVPQIPELIGNAILESLKNDNARICKPNMMQ